MDYYSASGATIAIISHLCFIALAWWSLQAVNFDKLLRANKVFQARLLFILVTIALGSVVSNFFIDYLQLGAMLSGYFNN